MEAKSFDPHVLFEPVPQHELDMYRLQFNIGRQDDQPGVVAADCSPSLLSPQPRHLRCNSLDMKEEIGALVADGFFNFDDETYGVTTCSTTQPHPAQSPGKRPAGGAVAPKASSKQQRVNGWMPPYDEL